MAGGGMIIAVVQARVSSARLPSKVLAPVMGEPMLARQLERLGRARNLDRVIVAASEQPGDDAIERLCADRSVESFRGSLDDVLDRVVAAVRPHGPDHVVRLTGDCPLADPELIDAIVAHHVAGGFEYTSNTLRPTYPDGLDTEVVAYPALEQAWREAKLPSEREHVTPYLKSSGRFRTENFAAAVDHSRLRWTVDEPEDLELVREIFAALFPANPAFSTDDVLELLRRRPELATMNAMHRRDEGYLRSLERDARIVAGDAT
ncbi:MAG: glycosyltransferase family protein [Proteobacteria bacterium]|nr:glycosyltransferase family protein [Pseudomonadota bacterium]